MVHTLPHENITRLVKKGDYVYKGQAVGRRKGHLRIPIPSSVSGTVVGFEEHTYLSGKKVPIGVNSTNNVLGKYVFNFVSTVVNETLGLTL